MHMLLTAVALALTAVQPAAKPDFSGDWRMNVAKSDFGMLPPPISIVRTITHAEPALTIVETQRNDAGEQSTTRKYVTDGSPTQFTSQGAEVRTSAKWNGAELVVVSTVDAVGVTFNDVMTLSADGKTLTSQIRISSPQGALDLTVVFDKQ